MRKEIQNNWYQALVEDCEAIITEGVFTSRWSLIQTYHNLGKRILEENDNFDREKIYGKEIVQRVSASLQKSERTVLKAIQFARIFPDLDALPEGKNISWHKICNNLLPKPKEQQETGGVFQKPENDFFEITDKAIAMLEKMQTEEMSFIEVKVMEMQLKLVIGHLSQYLEKIYALQRSKENIIKINENL